MYIVTQKRTSVIPMQAHIEAVTDGVDLSFEEAREAANAVFEGASEAQIGALLAALRAKGETETEIAGFAAGMRGAARQVDPDRRPLVDTCGTGGDAYDTINVSTTAAIVAAGAGVAIAKHGNYSVSSASGSADVLDELGVTIDASPPEVERTIEERGIGFMLAPVFHPAMKAVIGPRKELGMRTIFNALGPLTNPAGADAQVAGVYDRELVPVCARALAQLDVPRALVVHGSGMDEIALHGRTTVAEVRGGDVEEYAIEPADLGLDRYGVGAVAGGTPTENAADTEGIVAGEVEGAKREIVLANAGAAIYVADLADSLAAGVERAREAIDSGTAAATLDTLRQPVKDGTGAGATKPTTEAEPEAGAR
jgi:anthranilate phosphoribosyltransferase